MESVTRRALIAGAGAAATLPLAARAVTEPRFPQKGALTVRRIRPPLLETPFDVFDAGEFTPNDRFFVRWHWGGIPDSIDATAYRLAVRGAVRTPLSLTLDEVVRTGTAVELAAVNQCAGNGRSLFDPRVPGAQWTNGAMGNALWRGVRLRDLLDRAGLAADAKFVRFTGLDTALVEGAPQFKKSLPLDIARAGSVIVAFAMNGAAMPLLNGYPLRLVVPGWFSTYWVKMLSDIEVLTAPDDNYWMAKAYRMPAVPVKPGDTGFPTVPISTMPPRAFVTSHADDGRFARGRPVRLRGIALGGDAGVAKVEIVSGGTTVRAALGPDRGAFGFRRWTATLPASSGPLTLGVRCTNANGVSQPDVQAWNPGGYARNLVERIALKPV